MNCRVLPGDIVLLALVGAVLARVACGAAKGAPLRFPNRLELFKVLGKEPAWTPLESHWMDTVRFAREVPANIHDGGSSKTLPWVVPSSASKGFVPETWTRLRPAGDHLGPERIECTSVPPLKFYLLEEALLPNCPSFNSGAELINVKGANGRKLGGQHLGELFFYMQLRNHTWRTYDPMEAQIVVVPAFLNLLSYNQGFCGSITKGLDHISNAVLASPRYKVNEGKDFLMLSTGFVPHITLFSWGGTSRLKFQHTTRNFIYVSRLNGKFYKLRSLQRKGRCVIAAPYTSQTAVSWCTGNDRDGLECPDLHQEDTFEEFMTKRDYNMFLMGQADNRVAYMSRRLAITQAHEVYPPNFMIASSAHPRQVLPPRCTGDPEQWNGCFKFHTGIPSHLYSKFLRRSKLSLMIAGDDPSSSRFYDALTLGAPNVVISEGWYDQSAPFRCRVPYDEISYFLNEADFQAATYSATTKAMKQLYDNNAELLRRIWEAQRKYAKDLVWHVPGSRVAGNVLEQAFRSCLTEYRGNNDAT
eukprot:CAMPEP_0117671574 /NCGR_PEP_ID=MMETSP0804-20121206/13409_1 /TAXON_ID=1074897 /ORGANISM="Tetraselmis astigmatica, Strain CCMP880" /LENGTH=528 /DNA_ID=CAMNT_0005480049 /DNA_START=341 /DNA_END=1928 /DNA_ORIENTATION=+